MFLGDRLPLLDLDESQPPTNPEQVG